MIHLALRVALVAAAMLACGDGQAMRGQDLAPTVHPPLPADASRYWLVPDGARRAPTGRRDIPGYSTLYGARDLAARQRFEQAEAMLVRLVEERPDGYLRQAATTLLAEVVLARGDASRAAELLEEIADAPLIGAEDVLLALGVAAERAGERPAALDAYRRVYYDFPLSAQAADAQAAIERLETPALVAADRFRRELARAERLFAARRWAQARAGFEPLARAATAAADRELIALRLAQADHHLDRPRQARDALRPLLDSASRRAEARFFYATATRALGDTVSYLNLARQLVVDFPDSPWAEETLNNLASHYIIANDDEAAVRVFREYAQAFPKGKYAERAAWRIGWWAYTHRRFEECARTFEAAAAAFPRADLRPAWLYWSGRARDQSGARADATARYRLTVTDYLNSYYGRLAVERLVERREPPAPVSARRGAATAPPPPTADVIRQLIAGGFHDDAWKEVQFAQQKWGDSPLLQATAASLRHALGLEQQAMERFLNIRGAITQMKRAYPQYLAAGGEQLPPEILRVMYPLAYWPLIQKYAAQRELDPYLMASLIAQESTFTADIRSAANAHGLMQLIPETGRQYARRLGLRYSLALLSQPEANLRMGMAYFHDLSTRFGGDHFALAAYNAGPHRVARWRAERPGVAQDEFIDDIPFPETQNYVKRILGQAEDYRRLYGGGILTPLE